jgi:hypothetical protein
LVATKIARKKMEIEVVRSCKRISPPESESAPSTGRLAIEHLASHHNVAFGRTLTDFRV